MSLLEAGTKCNHPHCGLMDYLPYKCQFCSLAFCSDHFRPDRHTCTSEAAKRADRIAPNCPLCSKPVTIPTSGNNTDPNDAMERHFQTNCEVMLGPEGVRRRDKTPRCYRTRCEKVLYTPIQCESCKHQFCPEHRDKTSHKCEALPSASAANGASAPASTPKKALGDRLKATLNTASTSAAAATKAAKDSIPRPTASNPAPSPIITPAKQQAVKVAAAPPPVSSSSTSAPAAAAAETSTKKHVNPFSKTDRRARAEAQSKYKALKSREAKGILSAKERNQLAELEEAKQTDSNDCSIM